jgi:hypothetical protein
MGGHRPGGWNGGVRHRRTACGQHAYQVRQKLSQDRDVTTRQNRSDRLPPLPFVIGLTAMLAVPFVITGNFLLDLLIGSGVGLGAAGLTWFVQSRSGNDRR